jgi:hypothetical protein
MNSIDRVVNILRSDMERLKGRAASLLTEGEVDMLAGGLPGHAALMQLTASLRMAFYKARQDDPGLTWEAFLDFQRTPDAIEALRSEEKSLLQREGRLRRGPAL